MTLTTEVQHMEQARTVTYPGLFQTLDGNAIILMTGEGSGTIISTETRPFYELGRYSEVWLMPALKPFFGRVILEQTP